MRRITFLVQLIDGKVRVIHLSDILASSSSWMPRTSLIMAYTKVLTRGGALTRGGRREKPKEKCRRPEGSGAISQVA